MRCIERRVFHHHWLCDYVTHHASFVYMYTQYVYMYIFVCIDFMCSKSTFTQFALFSVYVLSATNARQQHWAHGGNNKPQLNVLVSSKPPRPRVGRGHACQRCTYIGCGRHVQSTEPNDTQSSTPFWCNSSQLNCRLPDNCAVLLRTFTTTTTN